MSSTGDLKQSMCLRLAQMGDSHYQLGQMDKATDYYRQALAIAQEFGEPIMRRRILMSLALSTRRQGDFHQAEAYYKQALEVALPASPSQDPLSKADETSLLIDLGKGHYREGNLDRAGSYEEEALLHARELRALDDKTGKRLENLAGAFLGIIVGGTGEIEQCAKHCQSALAYGEIASDDQIVGIALTGLGLVENLRGKSRQGVDTLRRALPIVQVAQDRLVETETRAYLCLCLVEADQPGAALDLAGEGPEQEGSMISRRAECVALTALGLAQGLTGQPKAAHQTCQQSLSLSQQLFDRGDQIGSRMVARSVYGLGMANVALGHADEALASYRAALALAEERQDAFLHVRALLGIGTVTLQSDPEEARQTFELARSVAQELADPTSEVMVLIGLGQAQVALRHTENAMAFFQKALATAQESEAQETQVRAHMESGEAYRVTGQFDEAAQHYRQALQLTRAIHLRRSEWQALGGLGLALVDSGDASKAAQAIQQLSQALEQAQNAGNWQLQQRYWGGLGAAYTVVGEAHKGIDQYSQALAYAREIGDRRAEGVWLGNLASLYAYLGQTRRALEPFQQALYISQEFEDRATQARLLVQLGLAYSDLDEIPDAIAAFKSARALFSALGDVKSLEQMDGYLAYLET